MGQPNITSGMATERAQLSPTPKRNTAIYRRDGAQESLAVTDSRRRCPLVVTGGPAVGKTSTGRLLAERVARGAFIDVDDVRHYVIGGHAAPWDGDEGAGQQRLGVTNACASAASLWSAGFDVVVADVVTAASLLLYRAELPNCLVVLLTIDLEMARARAAQRPLWLTTPEFEMLHQQAAELTGQADVTIGVDHLSIQEQVEAIERTWDDLATG